MEIQARLKEYKLHFMVAIIVSLLVSSLVYLAPRILDILAYFWPLFASTAAFLAVAITCGGFQQLSEEATGEGIMEYVAGRPDDSHKYDWKICIQRLHLLKSFTNVHDLVRIYVK